MIHKRKDTESGGGYYLGGAPCWEGFWDHGRLKRVFIYRDHKGIPINKRYSLNIK